MGECFPVWCIHYLLANVARVIILVAEFFGKFSRNYSDGLWAERRVSLVKRWQLGRQWSINGRRLRNVHLDLDNLNLDNLNLDKFDLDLDNLDLDNLDLDKFDLDKFDIDKFDFLDLDKFDIDKFDIDKFDFLDLDKFDFLDYYCRTRRIKLMLNQRFLL
jgi:hypothetical protein